MHKKTLYIAVVSKHLLRNLPSLPKYNSFSTAIRMSFVLTCPNMTVHFLCTKKLPIIILLKCFQFLNVYYYFENSNEGVLYNKEQFVEFVLKLFCVHF